MAELEKIRIKYTTTLLQYPNVVGVGKGLKQVSGQTTSEQSIIVLVKQKLPPRALARGNAVPKKLDGICTDVLEVGDVRLLGNRTSYVRPAPGGVSIGHYRITAGTLGCVVLDRKTREPLILSNNHVLANSTDGMDGRARLGDPVYQPGPYDGGTREQLIGHLYRFVPLSKEYASPQCQVAAAAERFGNYLVHAVRPNYRLSLSRRTARENLVDAALAKPVRRDAVAPEILELGRIRGLGEASPGMVVKKSGRSSGVNASRVQAVSVTLQVMVTEEEPATFSDQFLTGPLAQPGDSGSLVLDEENRAVGLLFAGSDTATICNRMQNVLDLLQVDLPPLE